MPRPRKPARLWKRKDDDAWVILDDGRQVRTGFNGESGREAAEEALRRYLDSRDAPEQPPKRVGPAHPYEVTVREVLALYLEDRSEVVAGKATLAQCVKSLMPFWGEHTLDAVIGSNCRAYAKYRGTPRRGPQGNLLSAGTATVRRELGVLQAGINFAAAEGKIINAPRVKLSRSGIERDRWLTLEEARALLRAASPHLRRFILVSLATGTRATAALSLRWVESLSGDSAWVDVERGIIHRKGRRELETKKKRGAVAVPDWLHRRLRRWVKEGGTHVVMWKGERITGRISTAFAGACRRAGLEDVTPHTLKHTAVTWFFQAGGSREDAADYFDTSPAMLERVYRSHSPAHQRRAKAVMDLPGKGR